MLEEGTPLPLVGVADPAHRVDFLAARQALERIGDQLAEAFVASPRPSVQALIRNWRERNIRLGYDYLGYRTGLR